MSAQESSMIDVHVFGQVLRLNCPVEQQESLRLAAKDLDERLTTMQSKTNILQLERILSIVALNLMFELNNEKETNKQLHDVYARIQDLDKSLAIILDNVKPKTFSL